VTARHRTSLGTLSSIPSILIPLLFSGCQLLPDQELASDADRGGGPLCLCAPQGGVASSQKLRDAVSATLQRLQDGGFVEGYKVVWGATPNLPGVSPESLRMAPATSQVVLPTVKVTPLLLLFPGGSTAKVYLHTLLFPAAASVTRVLPGNGMPLDTKPKP
jgi:hypothetical protein